jgi:hypothetical protein
MAFYGNINNSVRSQFYFDKIYPNRKVMDDNAGSDQVFLGRYVLVEYKSEMSEDAYPSNFFYSDGKLYNSKNLEPAQRLTTNNCQLKGGDIVRILPGNNIDTKNEVIEFHSISVSGVNITSRKIAKQDDNPFWTNFNIDLETYFGYRLEQDFPKGRGYDSTVWQKTYDNGEERYVMVAELNSHAPTLDIIADAPTMTPLTPHFDPDSTNAYYRMHLQPAWGMWSRPASGDSPRTSQTNTLKSDENVNYKTYEYSPSTDEITIKEAVSAPAAIYYNKDGFSKTTRTYDDETENVINMLPTGISGQKYYDHVSGEMREAPDINELTIQLPAIGNAISDLWDVIYGESRNLDIAWNSQAGLRFIKPDENGGYNFDLENIQTLAGTINSLHDIMGMIIEEVEIENVEDSESVDQLDKGVIYYNTFDKKFYRKGTRFEYDPNGVEWRTDNGGPYYKVENLTPDSYLSNTYYIDDPDTGEKIPDLGNAYEEGQTYYTKEIEPGAMIRLDLVVDYEPNKYHYYKAIDKALYFGTEDAYYQNYDYRIVTEDNEEPLKLSKEYAPGRYHTYQDGNYIADWSEKAELTYDNYYKITSSERVYKYIYIPDYFYYVDQNTGDILTEMTETFDSNKQYYARQLDDDLGISLKKVELVEFEENKYYLYDDKLNDYTLIKNKVEQLSKFTVPPNIFTVEAEQLEYELYTPDTYWYKIENNYFKATENIWYENRNYYTLTIRDIDAFYAPNKFWYFNEDYQMWMIDESLVASQEEDKYRYSNTYYVISDALQIVEEGSVWNGNIPVVPHPVILGTRTEWSTLKEITDFSRSYNTLHGLILQLNHKIESDDIYTRDLNTLQGCLNYIHDCINKISELYPGEFVVVDNYGRMHSANLQTDNYLKVDINSSVKRPEITFKHKTPGVKTSRIESAEVSVGSSFKLPSFMTDNAGHISEVGTTTITLNALAEDDIKNIEIMYDGENKISILRLIQDFMLLQQEVAIMQQEKNII